MLHILNDQATNNKASLNPKYEAMSTKKIGTFYGVLVPNITMMLGVILFLRLSILVGHAGIVTMSSVILLSLGFMIITSLSIASIATNMRMGGGGVYYLITRSLGIEIGGALGMALYVSQIISITLTVTGFAYTLNDVFPTISIPVIELITLVSLGAISSVSSKGALKLQVVILVVLLIGVGSVFFGSMRNVTPINEATPLFGNGTLGFWQTFAFFYPAMTGIEAGMAMSGLLKKPGRSLYIGNIGALIFVALLYGTISLFAYFYIPRSYLISNPFIFVNYSNLGFLVILGILMATISSALGSILGAPRILESMARDGIVPEIFSRVYGKYAEPRWSLGLTVFLSLVLALSTNIDQIIPILTMICLIAYALLNLVAGLAELMNTVSWRPSVRTPWWLSLIGFFMAITMMLFVNVMWTFISITLFILLYLFIQGRNLQTGFQDIRNSLIFFFSRAALYHLGGPAEHAFVWHPQLLVMATDLSQQRKLAFLSHSLTRRSGILTFAAIVPESWNDPLQIESTKAAVENHLSKDKIASLVEVIPASSPTQGQTNLIRAYGIGPIQPNTFVLPCTEKNVEEASLIETIETCRTMRKNFVLFKDSERTKENLYVPDAEEQIERRVDLWWNGYDRSGFDLAVSLITTLRDGITWGSGTYNLQSVVNNRSAKTVMQKFFKDFIRASRLPFTSFVHYEKKSSDYLPFLEHYSKDADLTVICIRAYEEEEDKAEYLTYFHSVLEMSKNLNDCLYISCYDDIDHKEIYHYPST